MIHHVSIPARDPEHVATVLGELLGGYVGPFIGPIPGAWVAYADDGNGSGFEIYPERTTFIPGKDDEMGEIRMCDAPASVAFHALVSVNVDRETIERIGAREGWRTKHFWRGPSPAIRLFELYEFWIENRVMLELATPDMLPNYVKIANGPAQREFLARRGKPPESSEPTLKGVDDSETAPGPARDPLGRYVESVEQLISEIVVRNIRKSLDFYRRLGFALLRDGGDFAELTWEEHRLYLAERTAFDGIETITTEDNPAFPLANVRVMVPNVDDLWKLANDIGAKIVIPIGDRYYGLRDFTIADPDGFGIRFASMSSARPEKGSHS